MPPVCSHCKEIGHNVKRCKLDPITCLGCNSSGHTMEQCHRAKAKQKKKRSRRSKSRQPAERLKEKQGVVQEVAPVLIALVVIAKEYLTVSK